MQQSPEFVLQTIWKHEEFRTPQREIIESVLQKNDVIALLPTGAGKSICYQIPAVISEGICLVISPLIALMNDQINGLEKKGIKAMVLSAQMSFKDTIRAFDNLKFGNYKLLYLSPEKLQSDIIQEKLKELHLTFIAIDEAHCISEWGHDFRPSYLRLFFLKETFPSTSIIALTATATKRVIADIESHLKLKKPVVFKESHFRRNLSLNVVKTEDIKTALIHILKKYNEPSIVYVSSRKKTVDLSNFLNHQKISASYFHGGMTQEEKKMAYETWIHEKALVMVATNAFGMGIDKSNVRVVIHVDIPASIENYLQESGRAGRDSKSAYAFLLYNNSSIQTFKQILQNGFITKEDCKKVYKNLMSNYQIANGENPENVYDFNLQEFCNTYNLPILNTFNVLTFFENAGILSIQNTGESRSRIKITSNNDGLFRHYEQNPSSKELIQNLCRNYGGIFDLYVAVDEYELSKKTQISRGKLINLLEQLNQLGIISYFKRKQATKINFLVPREDLFVINSIQPYLKRISDRKIEKAKNMVNFIEQNSLCRNLFLQNYLGETSLTQVCGNCDICKQAIYSKDTDLIQIIVEFLKQNSNITSSELINGIEKPREDVLKTLRYLLENRRIELNSHNKIKLRNE
ncbi:RecQ family ATP-dependent DNA helicase [Namhaeicola litoreus]|uniref:ATP-dependent DNA helicase RecQ n=1 Tax=Namhaeicola litoreus TaxID=1052145 RepID=A0ABW3Y528_9FLAO